MQQKSILSNVLQLILMIGAIYLFSKFACSKEETTSVKEEKVQSTNDAYDYDYSVHKAERIWISEQICRNHSKTPEEHFMCVPMVQSTVSFKLDSLYTVLKTRVGNKEITPRQAGSITNDYVKSLLYKN